MSVKKKAKETFTKCTDHRNLYDEEPDIMYSFFQPIAAPDSPQNRQEYYCRFVNEHVLNAFLAYLAGKPIAPELDVKMGEVSVSFVEECLEAFKKYYLANKKIIDDLDSKQVAQAVQSLAKHYLFLEDVRQPYSAAVKVQPCDSTVALLILKTANTIVLAAVSRNPPPIEQPPPPPAPSSKPPAVVRVLAFLYLAILIASVILAYLKSNESVPLYGPFHYWKNFQSFLQSN